jgi:hypothetical protein
VRLCLTVAVFTEERLRLFASRHSLDKESKYANGKAEPFRTAGRQSRADDLGGNETT